MLIVVANVVAWVALWESPKVLNTLKEGEGTGKMVAEEAVVISWGIQPRKKMVELESSKVTAMTPRAGGPNSPGIQA